MKKITSLCLSLFCIIALVGCGGNEEPSNNKNTEWSTVKEAACTEEGLKEKYVNGELIQESIPVLGHDYGEWNVTLKETCTTDGKEERACSRCSLKEEKVIEAHHVLKDGYSFDIDNHYYECNNCTEKIDLANHSFTINKEDKYAYFLSSTDVIGSFTMMNVGYISTLQCDECDVKIIDYNLVNKYYCPDDLISYYNYSDYLGIRSNDYDLKYGLYLCYYDYIKFEYDSNFNITKVSFDNVDSSTDFLIEYIYKYDENNKLIKVEINQNKWDNMNFTFDLKYVDKNLSEVVYNVDPNNGLISQVLYSFDNDGNLLKETWLLNGNKQEEYLFVNGYLEKELDLSSGTTITYNNTFDENGNLLNHSSAEGYTNCTYDSNGRITSISYVKQDSVLNNNYVFEYDNDKLIKITTKSSVYTYQYSDNKVSAYDSDNNLVLEIEYISDYKITE